MRLRAKQRPRLLRASYPPTLFSVEIGFHQRLRAFCCMQEIHQIGHLEARGLCVSRGGWVPVGHRPRPIATLMPPLLHSGVISVRLESLHEPDGIAVWLAFDACLSTTALHHYIRIGPLFV